MRYSRKTGKLKLTIKPIPKPAAGFFSFSCCEGCTFEVLFMDNLMQIISLLNIKHFRLMNEKNPDTKFDIAFVEGAITTKSQIKELKKIRKNSGFLAAIGECACHGGIPSLRNFIANKQLEKYVYNQKTLEGSVKASGIGRYVKVDYYMYGCPIIKKEFTEFVLNFVKDKSIKSIKQFENSVCTECAKRGKDCFLQKKVLCLGAVTRGGCNALCPHHNVPCVLCRGPKPGIKKEKLQENPEMRLFRSWGMTEKEIMEKVRKFG